MTRKIWRLLCILALFLAGMLIYEGGVLFFRFHARREALYAFFTGICAAMFYLTVFCRNSKRDRKKAQINMFLTEGSAALLAVGLTLYIYRYQELLAQLRVASVVLFWSAVFIWKSLFSGKSRRLRENHLKEKIFELFPDRTDCPISEKKDMEDCVRDSLDVKRKVWELRWTLAILDTGLVAGFAGRIRNEWYLWVFLLLFTAGFAWIAGRDSIYTARVLSDLIEKNENQKVITFFLIYYQYAERQWESMIPMQQIYLPIILCRCAEYDKALELLKCMQRRPEEEAYYLVWEAEVYKQKQNWKDLQDTLKKLRQSIPHMPQSRRDEMKEKLSAYEKSCRDKGDEKLWE